jgi:cytochrome c biogenesis protein
VRFAVVLNLALALAVMIGTLILQMPTGIQNFEGELDRFLAGAQGRYGDLSGLLYWAGFYDLYNSLWFRLLIVTVVFSILICTLNRWQPTMRLIRNPVVRTSDRFLQTLSEKASFRSVPLGAEEVAGVITSTLKRRRYRIITEKGPDGAIHLYADRDRWSKLVTFVSHAALVLFILAAASLMNFGWREQSVYFYPGEPVSVGHGLDYSVRNDGFSIEYYDDGVTVKEYRNTLAVVREGKDVLTKTIIVNDPLRVDDVNYFLVSYQPALFVNGSNAGQPVQFNPMGSTRPIEDTPGKGVLVPFGQSSAENQPLDFLQLRAGDNVLTFELVYYQDVNRQPGENPPVYAKVYVDKEFEKPIYDGFLPRSGPLQLPGYQSYSFSFVPATTVILEVARDPGLGLLAFFFMVMAAGFTVSLYTSFTRCWARIAPASGLAPATNIIFAGLAEKNKVSFERDFQLVAEKIREELTRESVAPGEQNIAAAAN